MNKKMVEPEKVFKNDTLSLLVDNAILIAKFHKAKCKGDCDCSLSLLGRLCVMAGAKLTKEQYSVFM